MIDRRQTLAGGLAGLAAAIAAGRAAARPVEPHHADRVEALLAKMTLDEKIGQLNQPAGGRQKALNSKIDEAALAQVRAGKVGSYLHVAGAAFCRTLQKVAVTESRLGIPLLFAIDVIHGFRTIFPVPLAMASSFDPEVPRAAARIAAIETAVSGLHWTFAPMADVARDPRWGRVVEGAGEDPYWASRVSVAQIEGFQTADLRGRDAVLACAKHFGAYGAVAGGRDYDSADISERTLNEVYLPAFFASARAGAGTFMTAFNDIAGVPTTGNAELVRGTLRERWGYRGLVVSDWLAIGELVKHGIAANDEEAAVLALRAGVDMDMAGGYYSAHLAAAAARDPSLLPLIDEAAGHVLLAKARLGLFEDPYRFGDVKREASLLNSPRHRAAAKQAAVRSIVLLKNDGDLLPIVPARTPKIALVGALADDPATAIGPWKARGLPADAITLRQTLARRGDIRLSFAPGVSPRSEDVGGIPAAVAAAQAADLVVLMAGEDWDHSAESRSRADIGLPGPQQALADALLATGKPVVLLVSGGRPLAIESLLGKVPAALQVWLPGVEAGPAIADILFGAVSPAARLPMGMPRASGQLPYSYAHAPTGRPADPDLANDTARYHDVGIGPVYPFGHGLSYTRFLYDRLSITPAAIGPGDSVEIALNVTNIGRVAADEVVQLYVRDPVATVERPVKELRGVCRVAIAPAATRRIRFRLAAAQLAFWMGGRWRIEAGRIEVMLGASSEDIRLRGAFEISGSEWSSVPAASIETVITLD